MKALFIEEPGPLANMPVPEQKSEQLFVNYVSHSKVGVFSLYTVEK